MITTRTLGEMLLRRYVTDFITETQQLSSPVHSRLRESNNFVPTGDGAYFAIRISGNESGGGWRAKDDQQLPVPSNEAIKQARVDVKKFYHTVSISGLAEAVSMRGGEDAFASGLTDAINLAVVRAGAIFEETFLRGDGTGRITNVSAAVTGATTITVDDARTIRTGTNVVFLDNTTGLRADGPVQVLSVDVPQSTITVSSPVTLSGGEGVYRAGEQSEAAPPEEVTALGLPALVNDKGMIYNVSRTTFPILQSKVIDAGGNSLDEAMLRRLRRRLMIETAVSSLDDFVMISNHEQFDRYTEIALPFRRFNDLTLELGARQDMTSFEGRPWLVTWAAIPDEVYFLNLAAIERGVVRPLSIDEKVNMAWIPGQDAYLVLLKTYFENVGRYLNQSGKITNLSKPTY